MRMKDDVENRTRVPAPLASRRKFMFAAVATGGAGILSTELPVLSARGSADKAAQIVLPAATKDVTTGSRTLLHPRHDSTTRVSRRISPECPSSCRWR